MTYERFLSPGAIGKMTLKNRAVFPPMGTHFVDNGYVTDQMIAYQARRAEGGCGLNIVEIASVHFTSSARLILGIYDDKFIPGLARLAAAIKDAGGKACIQLWHGGRQHSGKEFGGQCWGPSAVPCPLTQETPHVMTIDEIREVIAAYGNAALRAKKAGFDAVELHGAHGYLIDCFLNAYSNTRTDEYGGDLEQRARFGREVIRDVRSKVGPDFPVLMRMSARENYPGGITLEDGIKAAKLYTSEGIDALDISQGCYGAMPYTVPPYFLPERVNVYNASQIKKNVGIPVIVAGKIYTPDIAEEILRDGAADFISLGRIQLADPDFVRKAAEDRPEAIIHCVACDSGCVQRMFDGKVTSCIFNPLTGYETTIKVQPAQKKKKVLVIGGGPGGLEAARVAAERGHEVTLFEQSADLGGQYIIAGRSPHKNEMEAAARHLGYRAMKAGVNVRLYTKATAERIKAIAPDAVIVAVGSESVIPKVPGIELDHVYDARKVIGGKVRIRAQKVAVIGGGLVGLEAAEFLAEQGKDVAVVEMLDSVGRDLEMYIRPHMMQVIDDYHIDVHVQSKCVSIAPGKITVEKNGAREDIPADAVVIAIGGKPDPEGIFAMASALVGECYVIGDAKKPGNAIDAIWQGHETARSL
ncbi:MAG: FAD-dependent oxidoreductase [Treponema sp.]|jgi:2,4-dienoyl-CoA reductase-like NADH-dependent reductase (Old Yellow Enzyme family)/thioredoxin reductase|nr:FAD-dependent oxidoreductase [Treponema sp.]